MSPERRRLFSRREEPLVSSGVKVNLGNYQAVQMVLQTRQKWQEQAWETYDVVGQVKYGVNALAALVSRVQFFVATGPEAKDAEPVRTEASEAVAALQRLGDVVTFSDLVRELCINLLVSGECYLVCLGKRPDERNTAGEITRDGNEETWFIRSTDEVKSENNTVKVTDFFNAESVVRWITLEEARGDTFIRIWRQHARKHHLADSHIRGILDDAEELLWWSAAARARAKSRLSDTGIVCVPSDMELPAYTEEDKLLSGAQRTAKRIQLASTEPISNPGSAASVAPIVVTYPANEDRKSGLEHVIIDRPQDELLEKRTERCLQNIEQGINLPVGVISGLGKATHWGGGQIEESTFRDHVEPLVLLICSALTTAFLQPVLKKRKYMVWYDNSNLIVHQDKASNSLRALELGAISWASMRRELGFSERDAPSDSERAEILEWLRSVRTGQRQGIVENPSEGPTPRDPNTPPTQNEPGKQTPSEQRAAPLKKTGQSPIAASGNGNGNGHGPSIDSDLISRLQVMADEKIRRALEKAGNKLRSRARKVPAYSATIRGTATEDIARTLGREPVIKLGINDLFDGSSLDTVAGRFITWVTLAAKKRHLELSAQDFSRAATNFSTKIHEIAATSLFSTPSDDMLVPLSVIHASLTEAGYSFTDITPALAVD